MFLTLLFNLSSIQINDHLKAIINHILLIGCVLLLLLFNFLDLGWLGSNHWHFTYLLSLSQELLLRLLDFEILHFLFLIFFLLLLVVVQFLLFNFFLQLLEHNGVFLIKFVEYLHVLDDHLLDFVKHGHSRHVL